MYLLPILGFQCNGGTTCSTDLPFLSELDILFLNSQVEVEEFQPLRAHHCP